MICLIVQKELFGKSVHEIALSRAEMSLTVPAVTRGALPPTARYCHRGSDWCKAIGVVGCD